jgi:hypothetical protein
LYSLDDVIAMGQEELQKFEMCLKRHRFANHNAPRDLLACGRLCVKGRSLVGLMCDASNSGGDQDDTCDEGCATRFTSVSAEITMPRLGVAKGAIDVVLAWKCRPCSCPDKSGSRLTM